VPGDIPALQKLIEVCVDAGLETAMTDAQVRLADAYLAGEHADEARVIAEDLIAREPWEPAHLERFRRALIQLGEPEPDAVIALRLSGDAPFTATDPFIDPSTLSPARDVPIATAFPDGAAPETAAYGAGHVEATGAGDSAGHDEIDLSDALEAPEHQPAAEPAPVALDSVFQQMREEVQETPDHSAQHLTLGRTYLEIGMIQEAISALKTAARSPRSVFEAAATLGRFFQHRDDTVQAIEWLERAAEAAPARTEEGRALLYDLGVALEVAGERARALAVFLELRSDVDDYRDVPSRIDRLGRVQPGG
jgi:tetratricopeptide (TPR) repeat protein